MTNNSVPMFKVESTKRNSRAEHNFTMLISNGYLLLLCSTVRKPGLFLIVHLTDRQTGLV
ncbi:hypothetical protein T05_5369 [Trichinella murrelli]|uniref:Uncharacterized protein n=1 Tax=Trichinella murrelli TaxID=144512 RepID=A0A0V0TMY8_9BILA|nr:hypothetical protein T05_5369 [Trichinella murrelli]